MAQPTPNTSTVTVTFSSTPVAWGINPDSLSGGSGGVAYTVFWKLSPASAPRATLATVNFSPPLPPALPPGFTTVSPSPGQLAKGIFNNNNGNSAETFAYHVVVTLNGQNYTSPDPELILQPPT